MPVPIWTRLRRLPFWWSEDLAPRSDLQDRVCDRCGVNGCSEPSRDGHTDRRIPCGRVVAGDAGGSDGGHYAGEVDGIVRRIGGRADLSDRSCAVTDVTGWYRRSCRRREGGRYDAHIPTRSGDIVTCVVHLDLTEQPADRLTADGVGLCSQVDTGSRNRDGQESTRDRYRGWTDAGGGCRCGWGHAECEHPSSDNDKDQTVRSHKSS